MGAEGRWNDGGGRIRARSVQRTRRCALLTLRRLGLAELRFHASPWLTDLWGSVGEAGGRLCDGTACEGVRRATDTRVRDCDGTVFQASHKCRNHSPKRLEDAKGLMVGDNVRACEGERS